MFVTQYAVNYSYCITTILITIIQSYDTNVFCGCSIQFLSKLIVYFNL